jgi:YD repeat-containing protein
MTQSSIVTPPPPSPANAVAVGDRGMAHAAALQLAESINRYWAELGYDAQARVVEIRLLDGRGNADEFGVISNLRNGVPALRLPNAEGTLTDVAERK